jgi:hypothetical protein
MSVQWCILRQHLLRHTVCARGTEFVPSMQKSDHIKVVWEVCAVLSLTFFLASYFLKETARAFVVWGCSTERILACTCAILKDAFLKIHDTEGKCPWYQCVDQAVANLLPQRAKGLPPFSFFTSLQSDHWCQAQFFRKSVGLMCSRAWIHRRFVHLHVNALTYNQLAVSSGLYL